MANPRKWSRELQLGTVKLGHSNEWSSGSSVIEYSKILYKLGTQRQPEKPKPARYNGVLAHFRKTPCKIVP